MIKLINLLENIISKPKAIFVVGSVGSGKSTIIDKYIPSSFERINSDDVYVKLLNQHKLGTNIKSFNSDQLSKASQLQSLARKETDNKYESDIKNRKDIVIDTTGEFSNPILKKKDELEELGYETFMIIVYASPITVLERNKKRERSLLPSIVLRTWNGLYTNIDIYKRAFNNAICIIKTGEDIKFDRNKIISYFENTSSNIEKYDSLISQIEKNQNNSITYNKNPESIIKNFINK